MKKRFDLNEIGVLMTSDGAIRAKCTRHARPKTASPFPSRLDNLESIPDMCHPHETV